MGVIVTYSTNNSGGSWWLSEEDWEALEAAGWNVHWVAESKCGYSRPEATYDNPLLPVPRTAGAEWLGGVACSAAKEFDNPRDAIPEFERITGQNASDIGCNCCGPPHSFEYEDEQGEHHYASAYVTETTCEWS